MLHDDDNCTWRGRERDERGMMMSRVIRARCYGRAGALGAEKLVPYDRQPLQNRGEWIGGAKVGREMRSPSIHLTSEVV